MAFLLRFLYVFQHKSLIRIHLTELKSGKIITMWCTEIPHNSCILWCLISFYALCRWKLLDFAELNQSSTSFFDIEKPETAISRWSRARKQAAKVSSEQTNACILNACFVELMCCLLSRWQVGKGLSKDESARKLALQHWLEAVSLICSEDRHFFPVLCSILYGLLDFGPCFD